MTDWIDATTIEGPPNADHDPSFYFKVGQRVDWQAKDSAIVTRITIQHDLPGLYCDLRRACVWIGERMVFEAPVHNLAGIYYPAEASE